MSALYTLSPVSRVCPGYTESLPPSASGLWGIREGALLGGARFRFRRLVNLCFMSHLNQQMRKAMKRAKVTAAGTITPNRKKYIPMVMHFVSLFPFHTCPGSSISFLELSISRCDDVG